MQLLGTLLRHTVTAGMEEHLQEGYARQRVVATTPQIVSRTAPNTAVLSAGMHVMHVMHVMHGMNGTAESASTAARSDVLKATESAALAVIPGAAAALTANAEATMTVGSAVLNV